MKKFNIYKFLENRPLSYSAFNTFSDPQWGSPQKWYDSYILGKRQTSKELTFGSQIDKQFQDDPTFLSDIPRIGGFQSEMRAVLELGKKKVYLLGFADQKGSNEIRDLKTGKNPWTQKKADETKQLTFYALLAYLIDGIPPELMDFYIDYVPTYERADLSIDFVRPIKAQTFKTKRTMTDIILLCEEIDRTVKAMQATCDKMNKVYNKTKVER